MSGKRKLFTAAFIVPDLIADTLESELDSLSAEERVVVEALIAHLRHSRAGYAHRAVSLMLHRTLH